MHSLTRSITGSVRLHPRLLAASVIPRRHIHHPPAAADISEWIAYFEAKDAKLDKAQAELDELKMKLAKMERTTTQSEESLATLRAELGKRKTDYSMLTAVEVVVEAAYRNGTILPSPSSSPDSQPTILASAIAELQKDPLLTSIVEEACLKLDMRPEEAWEQLPSLYDRLAKKAGLMDSLRFSSGYDLLH